jgi:glycopeptide antibiotics resistance protein
VRLAVLAMLSRPDVSDLAVVSIGIGLASYVAVMTDFGFKKLDETLNELVRVSVVRY